MVAYFLHFFQQNKFEADFKTRKALGGSGFKTRKALGACKRIISSFKGG